MDEAVFAAMKSGEPDLPDEAWTPGLWAHMVKLVDIYAKIQELHRHLVYTDQWDEPAMDESVGRLEADLISFDTSLGPELSFSEENLALFVGRGLGSAFVAFHLGYHHYYTLVFYQYLDQRRPHTKNGKRYARECKRHASIICDVLKASRETPGAKALYNIVGHVTIVSSSVLLHTYLFGESYDLDDSRRRLESNLVSLTELRSYWPSVELMVCPVVSKMRCILLNKPIRSIVLWFFNGTASILWVKTHTGSISGWSNFSQLMRWRWRRRLTLTTPITGHGSTSPVTVSWSADASYILSSTASRVIQMPTLTLAMWIDIVCRRLE